MLSQRGVDAEHAPIPSLLLTGAVHHHLVRERSRTRVGLIVESADAREVHHIALLLGYGASAVNPYLAMATVEDLAERGDIPGTDAADRGEEPGQGARQGRAQDDVQDGRLDRRVLHRRADLRGGRARRRGRRARASPGTTSRLGGVTFEELAEEVLAHHRRAFPADDVRASHRALAVGGEYQWRREGELHLFNPQTVFKLQHSTRSGQYDVFKQYTKAVDDQAKRLMTLRGLFAFKEGVREPVPIDEVEPVESIVTAVRHRRDLLRLHLPGDARDARDRDEPPRRPVEHR